jgi:methylmalonyl-CoA mutase
MTALSEIEQELKAMFPSHSYEQWKAAAEELLKGKPFDKVLVTPTYEGFDLQPVFRKDDLESLAFSREAPGAGAYVRGSRPGGYFESRWKISQELPEATAAALNAVLLRDLKGGADEVHLLLDAASLRGVDADQAEATEVGACGLSLASVEDLEKAFAGVEFSAVSLFVESGAVALPFFQILKAFCAKKGVALSLLKGSLGADPLGAWARAGKLALPLESAFDETATLIRELAGSGLGALYVDGNLYHNAGSSAVQELGFTLAAANAYLKAMVARGLSVKQAVSGIRVGLGIGSHYFLELSKLRAFRMLWAKVLGAWGLSFEDLPLHLHARTSLLNKTVVDPYVNMLRVTSEAFAAVLGGCDSLHVGPFDESLRLPDEFSRRIARNVHFILAEECELTRVVDPAGGSYYVEWLTDQVAQKAWQWFQKVEAEGGWVEAMRKGMIQKEIASVASQRISNVQKRRDIVVGTNQYPNAKEQLLDPRTPDFAARASARAGEVALARKSGLPTLGGITADLRKGLAASESVEAIPARRVAESIEQLRRASLGYAAKQGHAPRIFQANWGASRGYRLRADWTSAFFQVGGFEMLNERDFESVESLVEALRSSGSRIAVITSSDDHYATMVEPIAKAIKAADSGVYVMVAGAPGEQEAAWRAAGVDDFVNVRANNYAMLASLMKRIGVLA